MNSSAIEKLTKEREYQSRAERSGKENHAAAFEEEHLCFLRR